MRGRLPHSEHILTICLALEPRPALGERHACESIMPGPGSLHCVKLWARARGSRHPRGPPKCYLQSSGRDNIDWGFRGSDSSIRMCRCRKRLRANNAQSQFAVDDQHCIRIDYQTQTIGHSLYSTFLCSSSESYSSMRDYV